jgi:endoglycosylceramidase
MSSRVRILLLLISILAVAPGGGLAARDIPVRGPLRIDGRWFRDRHGRAVVLHGLFGVWKVAPFYPPDDATLPTGFTEADADHFRDLGFDVMRLAWFWRGLEPAPGVVDPAYLEGIAAVVQKLAARGVFVVLDAHQDMYGERFKGLGFPDWATEDDGIPLGPDRGFPLNYLSPATSRAFDNLYADRAGLWDAFGHAWTVMARRFLREHMVVGYDLMNEPWPGSKAATCSAPAGCRSWDRSTLQPFLDAIAAAIRAVDRRRTVFYEPIITFNQGASTGLGTPPPGVAPAGLSFHNQCPTRAAYQITHDPTLVEQARTICPPVETRVMQNAEDAAARLGGPPLMTEVAATTDADYDGLNCLLERSERFMTGFTYGLSWRSGELRALDPVKTAVLARTYPRAVAGTPLEYGFDVRTGRFHLRYATRARTHGQTVITVPVGVQYPGGYQVTAAGARVTSAPGASVLTLRNRRDVQEVEVEVTPTGAEPAGGRPDLIACPG